jgi:hypothetical protein
MVVYIINEHISMRDMKFSKAELQFILWIYLTLIYWFC